MAERGEQRHNGARTRVSRVVIRFAAPSCRTAAAAGRTPAELPTERSLLLVQVETELSGNAARGGSGGALALQTGASVSAHNSLLSSNCAALGGGAISLQGTASLSLSSSSITSNAAFFGAFIGYEDPTAALSGVALSELTILNNAAVAGALYGMISGSQALQVSTHLACL